MKQMFCVLSKCVRSFPDLMAGETQGFGFETGLSLLNQGMRGKSGMVALQMKLSGNTNPLKLEKPNALMSGGILSCWAAVTNI